jgi:hypothetical protein
VSLTPIKSSTVLLSYGNASASMRRDNFVRFRLDPDATEACSEG